ncbi:MAG: TIR domain-containing protein [Anaerolineae bacterium]|nr:TIR domain-containing protein [Anaerolineae bacterium]
MRLFISYSHEDEGYVAVLADHLRDEDSQHDVWLDKSIFAGQEWWDEILDRIEDCECFVVILTPQSVASIYCNAELNYALALNKPILPFKYKQCDIPSQLDAKQVGDYAKLGLDRVLRKCERALSEIRAQNMRGIYAPPKLKPQRPTMPKLASVNKVAIVDIMSLLNSLTKHTRRSYQRWLSLFLDPDESNSADAKSHYIYSVETSHLEKVFTSDYVSRWMEQNIANGMGISSLQQARSAILWLAHILHEQGYLDLAVLALIDYQTPTIQDNDDLSDKMWLSVQELKDLLKAASEATGFNIALQARNYAMIMLIIACGLSRDEIALLRWADLKVINNHEKLSITGRTGKVREITLPSTVKNALASWKQYHPLPVNKYSMFSRIFRGGTVATASITDKAVWMVVRDISKRAGISKVSPNVLRRSFARNAFEAKVPLVQIQEILGLSSLDYVHKLIGDINYESISELEDWTLSLTC